MRATILRSSGKNSILTLILPLLILLLSGLMLPASAQSRDDTPTKETPFQFSFVPGVSSTDTRSVSSFSFNLIGGYNGAFRGFELGTGFNGNRYDVSGLQISGAVNVNERAAEGMIVGGAVNYSRSFSGFMLSGAVNAVQNESEGFLLAGASNVTGKQGPGVAMAGALNLTTGEARGVGIAPINISTHQTGGLQFGVINISGRQEGTQFGLINFAREGVGESVGLLSIVGDGRFNLDLWGNETGFFNAGIRIGTQSVYNVVSVGYNAIHGENLWQVGLGLGTFYSLNDRIGLETDLMGYHLNHDEFWTSKTSWHAQWRFHYSHAVAQNIRFFTGPSLNLLIQDEELSDELMPYSIFERAAKGTRFKGWVGWSLGMDLF